MSRPRLLAAFAVLVTVVVSAYWIAMGSTQPRSDGGVALARPIETTTTTPDIEALVASGSVQAPVDDAENELTKAALARMSTTTTTTIPSTTTTTEAATTTTSTKATREAAPTTAAAPTTTPPTTSPPTTSAGGFSSADEADFSGRINSLRQSEGKPGLSRDGSLDSFARSAAKRMAESGSLQHSNIGSLLPPWEAAGENIGTGGSVSSIFNALVASSGHLSNMLGDFTHMGIGVYRDGDGSIWTAHVFAR